MTRRFEVGPILVLLAAIVLLVSLFLDWYGPLEAWAAFEVVDVLLAVLAILALLAAVGALAPEVGLVERRWLPVIVLAVAVLIAAELIDPPPTAGDEDPSTGAWLAFGAALVMLIGSVLSLGRVSLSLAVEGRDPRRRVAVVDNRQDTTDTAAVPATEATVPAAERPGVEARERGRRG
jgi:hypothetical protein